MERIPDQNKIEDDGEDIPNFHEISENRKKLRKAISELGGNVVGRKIEVPKKFSSKEDEYRAREVVSELKLENNKASRFKIADFDALPLKKEKPGDPEKLSKIKGAVEFLKKQIEKGERDLTPVDIEKVILQFPELESVIKDREYLRYLQNKRFGLELGLHRVKKQKEEDSIQGSIDNKDIMIADIQETLGKATPLDLRSGEIISYKQNLAESGHICITPSTEKYLQAIGDKMLSGKPIFLHGPTGTGKTTLAEYAAKHFTGKDAEMIYCSPQTKETNTWGRTGVTLKDGAPVTEFIYGPLAKAIKEGRVIIFDEFTDLPKEQVSFLKGLFSKKPGDMVSIQGNGECPMAEGFQMIFTSNLKSAKNPEKSDLPPQMADEFTQNNMEVGYTPKEEAYDIMLSRLMNNDGSLDLSFYDVNTTLKAFCEVMDETQNSYLGRMSADRAKGLGELGSNNKFHTLEKFVVTQRSVEAIFSLWKIEKKKKDKKTFAEFIDERILTGLNFKEFSQKDRILAAKIFASKGLLTSVSAEDLDLGFYFDEKSKTDKSWAPEVLKLNTLRKDGGEDAVEELQKESGAVKHLTLKEVAELDPFNKRPELLKKQAEALLGDEKSEKDPFLNGLNKKMGKIFGKEKKNQNSEISASYEHPGGKKETITLDIEAKLQDFLSFYKKTNIDLPADFEDTIRDLWEKNQDEIGKAIEQNGFDELLILPGNIPLTELKDKMTMEKGYYEGSNFTEGGSFAGAVSQNADKPRLVLVHKTQNLKDRPELKKTLNIKGKDVKMDEAMNLEDYIVFQKKYFEETGKHLDEDGWTWLATKSGALLVRVSWLDGRLAVDADVLDFQNDGLGARPSRLF
ncbi:MAG: AAA family ATPase [bacterium]